MNLDKVKVYTYRPGISKAGKLLIKLIIIIIICILLSLKFCNAQEFLINNYDFTSQEFNLQEIFDFVKLFPNNKLTKKQIVFIYNQCEYFDLHPLVIFTWMEKESGIFVNPPENPRYTKLINLCMGYGLRYRKKIYGEKKYKYYSFEVQVLMTAFKFRQFYDSFKPGKQIFIVNLGLKIAPINAATSALLTMNPFYGKNNHYNREHGGVEIFTKIYGSLHLKWNTLK